MVIDHPHRLRFHAKSSGYYPPEGKTVGTVTALSGVYGLALDEMPEDVDEAGGASAYFIDSEWAVLW